MYCKRTYFGTTNFTGETPGIRSFARYSDNFLNILENNVGVTLVIAPLL